MSKSVGFSSKMLPLIKSGKYSLEQIEEISKSEEALDKLDEINHKAKMEEWLANKPEGWVQDDRHQDIFWKEETEEDLDITKYHGEDWAEHVGLRKAKEAQAIMSNISNNQIKDDFAKKMKEYEEMKANLPPKLALANFRKSLIDPPKPVMPTLAPKTTEEESSMINSMREQIFRDLQKRYGNQTPDPLTEDRFRLGAIYKRNEKVADDFGKTDTVKLKKAAVAAAPPVFRKQPSGVQNTKAPVLFSERTGKYAPGDTILVLSEPTIDEPFQRVLRVGTDEFDKIYVVEGLMRFWDLLVDADIPEEPTYNSYVDDFNNDEKP